MKTAGRIAIVVAAILLARASAPASAQDLSADAKAKEAAEARAKRNARTFENQATTLALNDRAGKRVGSLGERALYSETVISPDGSRVAVIIQDLPNESADLYVLDAAGGAKTRLTTSARTEFVMAPVWSPDGTRIAYVTIRKGQEGIYVRASNGQGSEEQLFKIPGAFTNLSDWSSDGKFLTYAVSDLKGGTLYLLPLAGGADRKPVEVMHSELRLFMPRFSPDGRFLSYIVFDKANQANVFVRPSDPAATGEPVQISDGAFSPGFWRRDGKELYYVARDRSMMVAEVSTAPAFSFTKPKVLFRQQSAVPERMAYVSADGERFLSLPPPRGPQLQQLTIFDRQGQVVQKVGQPGLYSQPSFSPDAQRLLVVQNDRQTSQSDLWTIELAGGKMTRLTNDTLPKIGPVWSPDGRYIYYTSFRDGDFPIFRRLSDGSGAEELVFRYTPGAGVGVTDISADGKFMVGDSGGVVLLVPLTGGDPAARKEIEYLREEFTDGVGRLSPDGKFMAYRSDEAKPERGEIYVRPFDASAGKPGEGKWQVSKDGAMAMLHWRADGKEIFFRGLNLESNEMLVMSAEVATTPTFHAGTPKLLFKLPGPLGGNLGNISRDGQRFVFAVNVSAATTTTESK